MNQYADREQWLEAIYLWLNVGDRAAFETTAFRERQSFTPRSFALRLAELLRCAGNDSRAMLVESKLGAMSKPDGLYL